MAENHNPSEEEPVCKTWARMIEVVLGLFLLVGTGFMAHYYAPPRLFPRRRLQQNGSQQQS